MKKLFHELMMLLGFTCRLIFAAVLLGMALWIGYNLADIDKVCLVVVEGMNIRHGCLP